MAWTNAYSASNQGFDNQIITPPPDSVSQFSVVTNNMNAEYGRGPGATVNVATRGGTNAFHATVYEFIRNTKLNAIGYFAPTGGIKPQFNRNNFGANFGGAILKDRLFYFVDYEGFRQVAAPVAFASLPTANQRKGILAVDVQDPYDSTKIYSPGTSILGAPDISPVALQVIGYFNALVPIDPSITATSNDYRGTSRFTDNSDKGSLRLDWQATKRDSLFLRVSDRRKTPSTSPCCRCRSMAAPTVRSAFSISRPSSG